MVGDARLLILLPLETRQVAPDNNVVLTLKLGNQTQLRLTQLIIVVCNQNLVEYRSYHLANLHIL